MLGDTDSRAHIQELQEKLTVPQYHSALRHACIPARPQKQPIQLLREQLPILTRVARWLARKHIHVSEEHTRCPCDRNHPGGLGTLQDMPPSYGRDTLVGWSPAEALQQHEGWPAHSHAHHATQHLFRDPLVKEATLRSALTQALHRHLTNHAENPIGAAVHLQLEAVRRAAAQMVHCKNLLLTHTEQIFDLTTREHMLRLIHYHAVHHPEVQEPAPQPTQAPHLRPQASKTPPEHPRRPATARPPPVTSTHDTPRPTSHPRDHPTKPPQDRPYMDVDAQDLDSPPRHAPPDPEHPSLTPATIRDPDLCRATLPGRALDSPLGWYRLQESWTGLTVKALQDLATPGKGLHEAMVDLLLWRAGQHAQGQHVWIPPIKWGQALTHDTETSVTRQGGTRLRRAPAERDHPADANQPEHWEQATALTRGIAIHAAGLRTPDDDLPSPVTDSNHPPPEVWCTVLERGHYHVVATTATSTGLKCLVKGTGSMLA